MSQGTALAQRNGTQLATALAPAEWTREYLDTLKATYAKGASDVEFALAVQVSKATGLRIDNRELWVYRRSQNEPITISISVDGFRAIAHASGVYAGDEGPLWCGKDGVWTDVWTAEGLPVAAKFTVYRADFPRPFTAVVHLAEFRNNSPLWQKSPIHQSGVRAATHAFRKAFRQEIARREMDAQNAGVSLGEAEGDPAVIDARAIDATTGEILTAELVDEDADPVAELRAAGAIARESPQRTPTRQPSAQAPARPRLTEDEGRALYAQEAAKAQAVLATFDLAELADAQDVQDDATLPADAPIDALRAAWKRLRAWNAEHNQHADHNQQQEPTTK